MEQQFSSSKVTVEYFDPYDVYKLVAPGLIPLLPLRNLHWKSHAGPPRSIDTLHVELIPSGAASAVLASGNPLSPVLSPKPTHQGIEGALATGVAAAADGFQAQSVGSRAGSTDHADSPAPAANPGAGAAVSSRERRHQIPGLRRTPYLKVLLVRCDDNDMYKGQTRSEIREWVKQNTPPAQSSRGRGNSAENHDAFEWLVVHVVIPNTVAATQPRLTGGKGEGSASDKSGGVASRWRGTTSTLLEKMLADFSAGTKGTGLADRVAQVRIGINDVPYDVLPRVVPAVPSGYVETAQDVEHSWADLVAKMKAWILSSFDMRVSQYEEDIKEKDAQRTLPGWNFCTFFILKEGLARGFESVGLVEDALVGYDELSVGLDTIINAQAVSGSAEAHGGALLGYTQELAAIAKRAAASVASSTQRLSSTDGVTDQGEPIDLQSDHSSRAPARVSPAEATSAPTTSNSTRFQEDIPISATKKPYRELILANNVSVFDFRCYIFARQISLLLRLGNASITREELLAKAREQHESLLHGVAPRTPALKPANEAEDLSMLAEVCRRTLEFIPAVSHVMRRDILVALANTTPGAGGNGAAETPSLSPGLSDVVDNMVASFAFSVAQQILAQTSTKALPVPETNFGSADDGQEQKATISEPKTMMHPARSSSLAISPRSQPPPSPGFFPGPGRSASIALASDPEHRQFLRVGLEELAARRAELYTLSRNILEDRGKRRGWGDGWDSVPLVGEPDDEEMVEISLQDDETKANEREKQPCLPRPASHYLEGVDNLLLRTGLGSKDDFYRLFETLTHKALRHYTVAGHPHSVEANVVDLAVLKHHLGDHREAASYFVGTIPFFADRGWSLLELSMLLMYSRCLWELGQRDDYVKVVLKLLSKAAMAEHERQQQPLHTTSQPPTTSKSRVKKFPDVSAIRGLLEDVVRATKDLPKDVHVPLHDFFFDVTVDGPPLYHHRRDGFSLRLSLRSLLADELRLDTARVRMSSIVHGGPKEVWLESDGPICVKPGLNQFRVHSNAAVPGTYEVDQMRLRSSRLSMHYERDGSQMHFDPNANLSHKSTNILRDFRVSVFQRANALDVSLFPAKQIRLDGNNSLEAVLSTGWNDTTTCDMRIRAATGGLRLLTSDTQLVSPLSCDDASESAGKLLPVPSEGGLFHLGALPPGSSIRLRFPFTLEQEVPAVAVRIEVSYTTANGTYEFVRTPSVAVTLALGVNVQDVFKHSSLFSRFTVSTASVSPLRLLGSKLVGSDLLDAAAGSLSSLPSEGREPVMVFPKQPATFLYRITRKPGTKAVATGTVRPRKCGRTMYLELFYSVLQDEIETRIESSLRDAFETEAALHDYSRLATNTVLAHVKSGLLLSAEDLERAALLGAVSTSFLVDVQWEKHFSGLGHASDETSDIASPLANFIRHWQKRHPRLVLKSPRAWSPPRSRTDRPDENEPASIVIPVDIPSITVVHTVDIRLQQPIRPILNRGDDDQSQGTPAVAVNQLLPATLHLRWSRIWDMGTPRGETPAPPSTDDIEFSYEVTAPQDTWLLGGRRRGHFVIPGLQAEDGRERYAEGIQSTPDTEADIPLLLVPLREGWLPYPAVEIREVRDGAAMADGDGQGGGSGGVAASVAAERENIHCETDYRNLGETVLVVADRQRVTLSLDASGPGGGPLVLESENRLIEGRTIV